MAQTSEPEDLETEIETTVDRLWNLADELQHADPARLRELIRRMVARIDLYFDHVKRGPRIECPLSRGTIDLRPDPILYRLISRGERSCAEPDNPGTVAKLVEAELQVV